jgi:hypothetical protein
MENDELAWLLKSLVLWDSASYPWYAPIVSIDRNVSSLIFQARCTIQQQTPEGNA